MNENKKTDREKLIDMIVSADISLFGSDKPYAEVYADYLLSHGVTFEKQGEWIEYPHFNYEGSYSGSNYKCSNCHYYDVHDIEDMNYCPNCGARMMKGAKNA